MRETETIRFADFVASRATSLYRYALVLARSRREAEDLLKESLIRTGLAWREAVSIDPEVYARAVMTRLATLWRTAGPPATDEVPPDGEEIAALAEAPTTRAPRDVAETVARGIATRRRRNRNRGTAVAAALALVILLALGVSALRAGQVPAGSPAPAAPVPPFLRSSIPGPAPVPQASPAPAALDRVIDRDRAVRLPIHQELGGYFRAEALGANGIVLGGTGFDHHPFRATDGLVWAIGPEPGHRVLLKPPPPHQPWAHAAGSVVAAWAGDAGDRYELFCADPSAPSPVARQVSRTGVARTDRPIRADGDVVVWFDDNAMVRWVRGCAGTPRNLDVPNLLGLSYPEVFYANRDRVHALNLESRQSFEVGVLSGAANPAGLPFAGNNCFVAWVLDGSLHVLDRRDGSLRRTPLAGHPDPRGLGRLSVGDRLVAYAYRIQESEVEYGFVYDLVTGTGMAMPTETFASRGMLLWRDETSYLVAPVRTV